MPRRQNEAEYQEIKKILSASNISSAEKLQLKIDGMMKAARLYSLAGLGVAIVLLTVLPKYALFIILLFSLYMAWLWSSTLSSKHYFKRYLDEKKL